MTREEALKTLIDDAENGYVDIEEVKLVFSALEQETCEDAVGMEEELDFVQPKKTVDKLISVDVLDKIRAEIEGKYRVILKDTSKDDWAVRWNDCLDEVLQVIDKYKAESEEWWI